VTETLDQLPRRRSSVILADDDTRSVLIDPRQDVTHVLNPTARAIWELCDGTTTVEEVVEAVCQIFSVTRQDAIAGVNAVVQQLVAADLVGWVDGPEG
jgi:hypothetical protein